MRKNKFNEKKMFNLGDKNIKFIKNEFIVL